MKRKAIVFAAMLGCAGIGQSRAESLPNNEVNLGFYVWSEADAGWLLEGEYSESTVDSAVPESTDVEVSNDAILYKEPLSDHEEPLGSQSMARQRQVSLLGAQIDSTSEPTTLKKIVVTAEVPRDYTDVMVFYRPATYRTFSGGGGSAPPNSPAGFARRKPGGLKRGSKEISCSDGQEERMLEALRVIPPLPAQGSVWVVTYADGHAQAWVVTEPLLSTKGLQPLTPCVTRASRQ